jgi:Lyzozyme M1 (1,4-beta-N-acetylmuramidase)
LKEGDKDMEFKGIDVSKWNGTIDWQKVKGSGIDFAIIREGFGVKSPNQIDEKFKYNITGAKNAGISCGAYHYSYAVSVQEAVNEAQFCLENIRGYQLAYPIAFDAEVRQEVA